MDNEIKQIIVNYYNLDKYADVVPYSSGVDIANRTLSNLKGKVEQLQEYYYHNTDDETSEITHKTLEDVIEIIEDYD